MKKFESNNIHEKSSYFVACMRLRFFKRAV